MSWIFSYEKKGLLIYTNSVTKETLFIYPAISLLILECFYLTGKDSKLLNYFLNFIFKIILLFIYDLSKR